MTQGHPFMRQLLIALCAALMNGPAFAQPAASPTNCFPPPISDCGKGAVRGVTSGVEWGAWWVEHNFDWQRVHWYRAPGATVVMPAPGLADPLAFATELWRLNLGAGTVRNCITGPHPEARPACLAMIAASELSRPPPIFYNVAAATAADGTRPGYKLTAAGALATDGTRHRAGAWCECWRGAAKPGATQYCLVTQTASYSACKRQP